MTSFGNSPFSNGTAGVETLARCGESRLIERLKHWLAPVSPPAPTESAMIARWSTYRPADARS